MDCDDNGIRGGSSTRLPPSSSLTENDLVEDIGDLHINSSPSTSYRSLNDLPVEILREIVEELTPHEHRYDWDWDYCSVCHGGEKYELDQSDIRNLRLVNRLFCELASPLLLPHIHIDISQTALDTLEQLLVMPRLASGVRSIKLQMAYRTKALAEAPVYFTNTRLQLLNKQVERYGVGRNPTPNIGFLDSHGEFISEPAESCEAASNFDEICKSWSLMMEIWEEPAFDTSQQCERDEWSSILRNSYERFKALHLEQSRLVEDGIFTQKVASAIKRLGKVEHLVFYNTNHSKRCQFMEESDLAEYHPNILLDKAALTSWLEAGLSWKINEALFSNGSNFVARLLTDLPVAIHQAGHHLKSLVVNAFPRKGDYSMILPPTKDRDSLLHQLRISCQDLQSVHIDHHTHPPPTRTAPIEGQDKEIIDGYISAVISSPKLKTLNIDLTCFGLHLEGGSRPGDGYHLGPALSKCPPFPYLKELRVCGVKLDQQEFFTFVQGVGHRLRRLYVDVKLQNGSWVSILELLRDRLAAQLPGIVKWGLYTIGLRLKGGEILDAGFLGDSGTYESEDVINVGAMDYLFGVVEDNPFL
ncbi:Putative protein of unknown function [Podospora comata]|uniref:F-box domain-containing protein n=1 Tax=Podospora comata TaxID=48703 RepID=A0ABY6SEQ1_PODCO|nr:Putative protein of unknown function [Podospora comata]